MMEMETIQTIAFMAISIVAWQMMYAFVVWISEVKFKNTGEKEEKLTFGEAALFSFNALPGFGGSFIDRKPSDAGSIAMTSVYTIVMYGIFMYWLVQLFVLPFMEEMDEPEPEPKPKPKPKKKKAEPEGDFNNENNNGEDNEEVFKKIRES